MNRLVELNKVLVTWTWVIEVIKLKEGIGKSIKKVD